MADIPTYDLNDGTSIPAIGFGTYPLRGEDGTAAILTAIEAGYRLVDTAVNYENEVEVGEAIRRSGLPRDEVRRRQQDPRPPPRVRRRDRVGARVAGPARARPHRTSTSSTGPTRARGRTSRRGGRWSSCRRTGWCGPSASPTSPRSTSTRIIDDTGRHAGGQPGRAAPAVPAGAACARSTSASASAPRRGARWASGARPWRRTPSPTAAEAHGVSPGQVILRWHVQLGSLPIPKSADPARQAQNLDVFGFELTDDEVAAISGLAEPDGRLFGGDPDTHEEM